MSATDFATMDAPRALLLFFIHNLWPILMILLAFASVGILAADVYRTKYSIPKRRTIRPCNLESV